MSSSLLVVARARKCPMLGTMAIHLQHGRDAERLAKNFLQSQGLALIAANVRFRVGEIDLIFRDDRELVIVEVRQRRNNDFGGALGSVSRSKQRKIMRAAQCFLQGNRQWRGLRARFDVVAVTGLPGNNPHIEWVRQAFTL